MNGLVLRAARRTSRSRRKTGSGFALFSVLTAAAVGHVSASSTDREIPDLSHLSGYGVNQELGIRWGTDS